jgi:hypothetical protein
MRRAMLYIIAMLAFLTVPLWSLTLLQLASGREVRPRRALARGLGLALLYGASWHLRDPTATRALLESAGIAASWLNVAGGLWLGVLGALLVVDHPPLRRKAGTLAAMTMVAIAPLHILAHEDELPVFGHEWRGPFLEIRLTLQALMIVAALIVAYVPSRVPPPPADERPAAG